jgi:hypothetical protein
MGRRRGNLAGSDLLQRSARMLTLIWCCWGPLMGFTDAPLRGEPPSHLPGLEARAGAPQLIIERRGDRLSIRAREAPWDEVLSELQRQTGIQIQVKESLAGELTDEFEALPLERGLRRLFREMNTVFLYAPGSSAGAAAGQLTQVWLWPKGDSAAARHQTTPPLTRLTPVERQDEMTSGGKTTAAIPWEEGAPPEAEPVTEAAEADQEERLQALEALAQQGDTEALRQALFEPDQAVQERALTSLAAGDRQGAIAFLVEMTKSDDPASRLQALSLLHESGQADGATVLSALRAALPDEHTKSYAVQALAERGGPEAIAALRETFRDPDPYVRTLVIESMADQAQARPLLQEAIADPDESVRALATFWLEQVTPEEQR